VHINQVVKWELNLCLLNQAILVYSTNRSRISLQIDWQNTSKDRRRHRGILPVSNPQRLSEGNYYMQSEKSEGNITIEFDARIYSEQAVKSAIYDFNIAAQISLKGDDKEIILVILQSPVDSRSSIEQQIYKSVLDHQVRIDVEKEFGPIRKLILAQAFFPCENLDQIIDEMDL